MRPSGRQLSLFGVEAVTAGPGDLEGLLAGPGQLSRMGGTARVSVAVDGSWRVAVLLGALRARGLAAGWEPDGGDGRYLVRTAYSSALSDLGERWMPGGVKTVPDGFLLDGQRLRLWLAGAGGPCGRQAYGLRLGAGDGEHVWRCVGRALAVAGLPAVFLEPGQGGPAFQIVGRRRMDRLVELIGEVPVEAPMGIWPS